MSEHPYEAGLGKNAANYVPLSPIGFLLRSAAVYPNRLAVLHGERRYSWREALERCRRLAAALAVRGVGRGDTVALMAPNIPEAFEVHFGVPMAGAVLNALNIRLDPETILLDVDGAPVRHFVVPSWHVAGRDSSHDATQFEIRAMQLRQASTLRPTSARRRGGSSTPSPRVVMSRICCC